VCGLLLRYLERGSNDGHQYELLTLDENTVPIINTVTITSILRQLADEVGQDSLTLRCEQLNHLAVLTYKAQRLIS
jgi:hypothetical protein